MFMASSCYGDSITRDMQDVPLLTPRFRTHTTPRIFRMFPSSRHHPQITTHIGRIFLRGSSAQMGCIAQCRNFPRMEFSKYFRSHERRTSMRRGSKSKYTAAQKRKAEHIEESYEDRGVSPDEAAARAWATVNKQSGGGEKSGKGRSTSSKHKAA